ncbi:MAG: DNA methyltransferase, partial [Bacteroides sp.]
SKYHPTQKPIELLVELYKTFTFENSRVIVPFAGSGVSLLAGAVSKRPAVGADISEEFKPGYMQAVDELFPIA